MSHLLSAGVAMTARRAEVQSDFIFMITPEFYCMGLAGCCLESMPRVTISSQRSESPDAAVLPPYAVFQRQERYELIVWERSDVGQAIS